MMGSMSTPLENDDSSTTPPKGSSLTGSSELERLRAEIDAEDKELLLALAERLKSVVEIGKLKQEKGLEVRDEKRRNEVMSSRIAVAKDLGISEEAARKIFEVILDHSETLEKK